MINLSPMTHRYSAHLLLGCLLFFGLGSLPASADVEEVAEWHKASINSSCVTVKDEGRVYCFGGRTDRVVTKHVTLFDQATNRPGYFADLFPFGMHASACAADSLNNQIYCFGGYHHLDPGGDGPVMQNTIFKIDPRRDGKKKYQQLSQTLPAPTAGLSCVEVPKERTIYCFGGHVTGGMGRTKKLPLVTNEGGQTFANYAFSFHLDTRKTTVIPTTRNIAADDLACVYVSGVQKVYCFGGDRGSYKVSVRAGKTVKESLDAERDTIFSFDPARKRFAVVPARLPSALSVLSCAPGGDNKVYCFGGTRELRFGSTGDLNSKQIITFDPARETVSISTDELPYPMAGHSCVASPRNDGAIYCFGGTLLRPGDSSVLKYVPR
jgi:hypothetical protein